MAPQRIYNDKQTDKTPIESMSHVTIPVIASVAKQASVCARNDGWGMSNLYRLAEGARLRMLCL